MKEAGYSLAGLGTLVAGAALFHHFHVAPNARLRRTTENENFVDEIPEFEAEDSPLEGALTGNSSSLAFRELQEALGIPIQETEEFELDDEQVAQKQGLSEYPVFRDDADSPMSRLRGGRRKKKRGKKAATMTKFSLKDVGDLHEKMVQTFWFRQDDLLQSFIEDSGVRAASQKPVDQLSEEEKAAAHVTDDAYPDYSGYDKTSPAVQKFIDEFGYQEDGGHMFATGQSQIWFLLPAAVPLFTPDAGGHLSGYSRYWRHIAQWKLPFDRKRGTLRISVGLYHKGAVYSPRGVSYRGRKFPWKRISNYYLRPRTTTSMPYIIPTAESLLSWIPRFGGSTPSAGQDCYTIWFHQDFAADASQLLLPEQFAKLDQVYSMCTVAHVFVGVEAYNERSMAYASALMPSIQSKIAKDPDFSGLFWAPTMVDIDSPALIQAIFKYFTIVKARAACRVTEEGWVPPPPAIDATAAGTAFPEMVITAPAGTAAAAAEVPLEEATVPPGGELVLAPTEQAELLLPTTGGMAATEVVIPTLRALTDEVTQTPKVPEIDSCCGHDAFVGVPYDSELRTCCEDGRPQVFKEDGSDPCLIDLSYDGGIGFEFKK